MIENFGVITKSGEILKSNLGVGINMYNNTMDKVSLDVFNTKGNGIYWTSEDQDVKVFSSSGGVIGYPSIDFSSAIVIYPVGQNSEFPAPNNAVVYNQSGELKMILHIPELISDLGKEKTKQGKHNCWFEMVGWSKNSTQQIVLTMWIGFADDFFEERTLDPESGEFGECLRTGRL
jgi:hypothetical protein